jgi:glutamate dehydrogenase (NAD(P)+)
MRAGGTREEAIFLAKTMGVKFRACGPQIGGGKSVIRFDADAPRDVKHGVLERWYAHIGPYLRHCYGTGGDVGVDEVSEATAITQRVLGLRHVQEGIARGHAWQDNEGVDAKLSRLKHGVEAMVTLPDLPGPRGGAWMVADVVTGLGVAASVLEYSAARGQSPTGRRVIIEGFGAVGAFAGYYLQKAGMVIVAASSRNADGKIRVMHNTHGLDCMQLLPARDGTNLPGPGTAAGRTLGTLVESAGGDELFELKADVFLPCAASHTTTAARLEALRRAGVRLISCGANNPFAYDKRKARVAEWVADQLVLMRDADRHFAVIPDFIANCGMARVFHFLMRAGGSVKAADILADAEGLVRQRTRELLAGHDGPTGLLERSLRAFVK